MFIPIFDSWTFGSQGMKEETDISNEYMDWFGWLLIGLNATRKRASDRIFFNPGKINFFWTRSLASLSVFSCAGEADSSGSLPCRGWTAAKGFFDEGFLGLQRKWRKKLSIAADTGVKKKQWDAKKEQKKKEEKKKKEIALKNAM